MAAIGRTDVWDPIADRRPEMPYLARETGCSSAWIGQFTSCVEIGERSEARYRSRG